jgi:hypothetical protein
VAVKKKAAPVEPHHAWHIAHRMVTGVYALLPLIVGTLLVGMLIYHIVEGLGWPDAFLNSSMLLGGMGPVDKIQTTLGKWLVGSYALFAGLVVIVVAGAMLAPVVHHVQRVEMQPRDAFPQ